MNDLLALVPRIRGETEYELKCVAAPVVRSAEGRAGVLGEDDRLVVIADDTVNYAPMLRGSLFISYTPLLAIRRFGLTALMNAPPCQYTTTLSPAAPASAGTAQ